MKAETTLERLKRLARERKAQEQGIPASPLANAVVAANLQELPVPEAIDCLSGLALTERQLQAVTYALQGDSFCMTGAAGTGKTTATRNVVTTLIQANKIPVLNITHRYLKSGVPGIVGCAFTNKAVQNIKRVMPADLQHNFVTLHKLIEFAPVFSEYWDATKQKMVKTMEFKPSRNQLNPLPESLKVIIIEEATMVGIDLWNMLFDALPIGGNIQIILIGDIQQLPPVFGKSIFIHAMQAGIKTVELDKVHRQALDSPILELAHRVLSGKVIPSAEFDAWNKETSSGKLRIVPWKKELKADMAVRKVGKDFMPAEIEAGNFDPYEDVILCPYDKAVGKSGETNFAAEEINRWIATYLATSIKWNPDQNLVFEVLGGMHTKYFRIGDKVLWNKTEHRVTNIKVNGKYYEKDPQLPSLTLDYWGHETDENAADAMMALLDGDSSSLSAEHSRRIDLMLESFQAMNSDDDGEKKETSRQCSHIITVFSEEFGESVIETSGELAQLSLAYAITVHKSQGSEYERVYFLTHKSQATMLFRELLYTGITRAKKELTIIGPVNLFVQGITSQRLPGKTLAEKIASFQRWVETSKVSETELPKGLGLLVREKVEVKDVCN